MCGGRGQHATQGFDTYKGKERIVGWCRCLLAGLCNVSTVGVPSAGDATSSWTAIPKHAPAALAEPSRSIINTIVRRCIACRCVKRPFGVSRECRCLVDQKTCSGLCKPAEFFIECTNSGLERQFRGTLCMVTPLTLLRVMGHPRTFLQAPVETNTDCSRSAQYVAQVLCNATCAAGTGTPRVTTRFGRPNARLAQAATSALAPGRQGKRLPVNTHAMFAIHSLHTYQLAGKNCTHNTAQDGGSCSSAVITIRRSSGKHPQTAQNPASTPAPASTTPAA